MGGGGGVGSGGGGSGGGLEGAQGRCKQRSKVFVKIPRKSFLGGQVGGGGVRGGGGVTEWM